jgi:hypothetical protein
VAADPVEEAADALYGLPLEDFTRERDARAKALRREKERDAAARVAKLPKPSQAAWAANALARERRDLLEELLAAGAELRQAQLGGGDRSSLRAATAAEREAVEALMRAAGELRPGGRKPSAATLDRLRAILHAAAADEDVREQLAAGRVVAEPESGGAWPFGAPMTAPQPPKRAARKDGRRAGADAARREREEAERQEREAAERREREAAARRAEAERRRLERRLATARSRAEAARERLDAAREAYEAACDEVARIEEQLN